MKIDVHNDKKLVPLDEVFFGSVVLIAGKYYLVIDNDSYTDSYNSDTMVLVNIENGKKSEFDEKLKVEIVNARMVVD